MYVCRCALENRIDEISEQRIGERVFERGAGYNPNEDNIVRSQARLLRRKLDDYFASRGEQEPVILRIPKGGYAPEFVERQAPAGSLLGIKTALNEFLAYTALAGLPEGTLSARSTLIMSYALCGMANLGSLGIMIGGFTVLVPERRHEVVALGTKSIVAGTIASCATGAVVGILT